MATLDLATLTSPEWDTTSLDGWATMVLDPVADTAATHTVVALGLYTPGAATAAVYCHGAVDAQVYTPGATSADAYAPGAADAQLYTPGAASGGVI